MDMNDDKPLDPRNPPDLAALLRVRPLGPSTMFLPRPSRFKTSVPGDLLPAEEIERIEAEFSAVVGALWDRTRGALDTPHGYADLHRLRDSLTARALPYERRKLEHDLRREHAWAAQKEIDRLREKHFGKMPSDTQGARRYFTTGSGRTLRVLFVCDLKRRWELLPDELGKSGWGDEFRNVTQDPDHVPAEGLTLTPPFPSYRYTPHPIGGPGKGVEYERVGLDPEALWESLDGYTFHADDTFGEAGERITNDLKHTTRDRAEIEDVLGLIGLRRAVAESVLYEHEMHGHVPVWADLLPDQQGTMLSPSVREVAQEMAAGHTRSFLALCTLLDWLDHKRDGRPSEGYGSDLGRRLATDGWLPDGMNDRSFVKALSRGVGKLLRTDPGGMKAGDFCRAVLENREAIEAARPGPPGGRHEGHV